MRRSHFGFGRAKEGVGTGERAIQAPAAHETYEKLSFDARAALAARKESGGRTSSKAEGLLKQVCKCIQLLHQNPRRPGLQTHEFESMPSPYEQDQKIFVATPSKTPPEHIASSGATAPEKAKSP